ncbi:MAG: protein kinase [Planctomycetaceae bacterium]
MSSRTASEFLDRVKSAGLLSSDRLPDAEALQISGALTDASLATEFVQRKLITQYQSDKLLVDEGSSLLIAGRYEIRELLGSGGMGDVYLARDRKLDRDVAVKVLPARLVRDADAVARFEREAKAMARLSHPNIVQAHDAGSDGEKHFLVMEFVDGDNLSQRLKQQGVIDPSTAADYAYQTALGLDHAHGKGLVHRDLKPSNLLVSPASRGVHPPGRAAPSTHDPNEKHQPAYASRAPQEVVKILDLGLARFVQDQIDDETITVAGTGLGTPDYMAPEQFDNARHADERSDVYALGCTLYHMLTGRAPFPGSSLSEKQRAHQKTEPAPIASPGVPAGLAQAVYKMMAKTPADRFQSARECAEALTPYVDVSSASLPNMNATVDWDGSVMTIVTAARRRRRFAKWATIAALLVLLSGGLGFGVSQFFGGDVATDGNEPIGDRRIAKNSGPEKSNPGKTNDGGVPGNGKPAQKLQRPKPDPWVLTVAKDGSGQFKTITAALDKVKPGMTIHLRDDAEYEEQLVLTSRHSGVTIVADRGATLVDKTAKSIAIRVTNVEDLTIRGLRIALKSQRQTGVGLTGDCYGTVFQDVEFIASRTRECNGVEFQATNRDAERRPTEFRGCTFRELYYAVGVHGYGVDRKTPFPRRGLRVQDSDFRDCFIGVIARDVFERLQIVGNRFVHASVAAVQLQDLLPGVKTVLVANNSFFDNATAIRLWDGQVTPADVHVCNNLVLSPRLSDFVFIDSGGTETEIKGGGDTEKLCRTWTLGENWREMKRPTGTGLDAKAWIPEAESSVVRDSIKVLSRDPAQAEFLCPGKKSELATEGAGKTDPSLPSYVGALPPKGMRVWDWTRTWRMPPGKHSVLTVSKDPKEGGKYRTINAALKAAKPWDTIRVLDDAIYKEHVILDTPAKHTGLVLESSKGATIRLAPGSARVLEILGVPDVRVRGFRLDGTANRQYIQYVRILDHSPGVVLEGLTFRVANPSRAILIQNVSLTRTEAPLVVRNCVIEPIKAGDQFDGITIVGPPTGNGADATGGVRIENNRVANALRGILLVGALRDVHVVGNRVWYATQAGMQFEDLHNASRGILLANNTAFDCLVGVRIWDNSPYESLASGQVQISHNWLQSSTGDLRYVLFDSGNDSGGDGSSLLKFWRIDHNLRSDIDFSPQSGNLPVTRQDKTVSEVRTTSVDPNSPDFLRPKKDFPLATGGAGGDLPNYAGAVPPKGVQRWDWDVTWRSRMMRAKYAAESKSKETSKSPE